MERFINADGIVRTGKTLKGNNLFEYAKSNPITFKDDLGDDAIYVCDYTIRSGLLFVGHAALFLQDKDGDWYFTEFAGKWPWTAEIHVRKATSSEINSIIDIINSNNNGTKQYVYIWYFIFFNFIIFINYVYFN